MIDEWRPYVAPFVYGLLVIVIAYSVYRYERDTTNNFNLVDALMERGKVSKWSLIILGSWSVHTAALVIWVIKETANTADFLSYGGVWVTPLMVRMFAPKGEPSEPPKP